jgi:hypothetical protein
LGAIGDVANWRLEGPRSYVGDPLVLRDVDQDGQVDLIVGESIGDRGTHLIYGPFSTNGVLEDVQDVSFESGRDYDSSGTSIWADLNQDGMLDAGFGGYDGDDSGAIWLLFGDGSRWSGEVDPQTTADRIWYETRGALLGYRLVVPGDLDGDGALDLMASSPGISRSGVRVGAWNILYGPFAAGGPGEFNSDASLSGSDEARYLGSSGADPLAHGDLDGDGLPDLVITALQGGPELVLLVLYGGVDRFSGQQAILDVADARIDVGGNRAVWTGAVDASADQDQDGFSDLLVGAPDVDTPAGEETGAVFVLAGSATRLSGDLDIASVATATVTGTARNDEIGDHSAWVGDLNSDGREDLAIGSRDFSHEIVEDSGLVVVFYGPIEGTMAWSDAPVQLYGDRRDAWFGSRVVGGDLSGDGIDDLVIASYYYDDLHGLLGGGG